MTYTITAMNPTTGAEELREYEATSLAEALTMVERADAGKVDRIYGIQAADYITARAEGIVFNEADGLLLDTAYYDEAPDPQYNALMRSPNLKG